MPAEFRAPLEPKKPRHSRNHPSGFLQSHRNGLVGALKSPKAHSRTSLRSDGMRMEFCAFFPGNGLVEHKGALRKGCTLAISAADSACNFESQCFYCIINGRLKFSSTWLERIENFIICLITSCLL